MSSPSKPSAYARAGVDIDAQEKGLAQVKRLAKSTFTSGVLSEIGSFGGLFRPDLSGMTEPVLVASADGVGTKLAVARTAAFFTISLAQLSYAFACRSDRHTMPQVGPFTNPPLILGIAGALVMQLAVMAVPPLRRLFEVSVLSGAQWLLVVGLALAPVTLVEVLKWVPRRGGVSGSVRINRPA